MSKKIILPLRKSVMDWHNEIEKLRDKYELEDAKFIKINDMMELLNNEMKPVSNFSNNKEAYTLFYSKGFSINEIAQIFNVSKQYVDTFLTDNVLKSKNESSREELKSEINYFVYVIIPEKEGFKYLTDMGIKATELALMKKYKDNGGTILKSQSDLRQEVIENVYKDYNEGVTYKELSLKYNKTMKTISDYLNICRAKGYPFNR